MLAVSSSELSTLITKLQSNNTKFLQKIDSCEDQLSSIKAKTLPIETKTISSTKRKKDLDTKLSDTEKIMHYLNTSSEVGPAIEIDLRVNPFGKQKLLFDAFDRLSEARLFLFEYRKKVATAAAEFESVDRYFKVVNL